jgi:hypothetical protein
MPSERSWETSAILLTLSVMAFLLAIPLCGAGVPWEENGTRLQQFNTGAGSILFLASPVLFVAGIVKAFQNRR